jgi:hypothetical protein
MCARWSIEAENVSEPRSAASTVGMARRVSIRSRLVTRAVRASVLCLFHVSMSTWKARALTVISMTEISVTASVSLTRPPYRSRNGQSHAVETSSFRLLRRSHMAEIYPANSGVLS